MGNTVGIMRQLLVCPPVFGSVMEHFNLALFSMLNAPAHPGTVPISLAIFFSNYVIWAVPLLFALGWLRGPEPLRKALLEATAAAMAGLSLAQFLGLIWPHPRPFMIPVGHTLISHVADPSFPSDHLTLLWTVAFSLLRHPLTRPLGRALALLGLPVAWARIYVGVHFPLDMLGAALVSVLSAWLACIAARWYLARTYRIVLYCHRRVFHSFIARDWVRR